MEREIQSMSTRQLLQAIEQFTKIHDFQDEIEDMWVDLDDDVYIKGIQILNREIEFHAGRLQTIYCECCGPTREYEWESSDNFTRHDLATIVDYLSLRLTARIGW